MADRSGYIGRAPGDSSVIIARKSYEPTGVQTDFTFNSGYTPGYCDVYLNGVRLIDEKDFTASDGSTVGLTSAAQSGDVVELVVYKAYNLGVPLADVTGNLDVTGNISASSSITGATLFGDGSNLSGIPGVAVTQYIDANSLTVIGSPGVSTITRLGVTDAVVTGIITANGLSGNVTGAAITVTGQATFSSNVSIGGTLTYEDVTNVDSVGLITARSGIAVTGGQLTVGAAFSVGHAGVCTATTFVGSLTGNVAGNASSASEATTVTVTANESGDELLYLAMVDGTSSGQAIEADSSLQYNPSKGEIKVGAAFSVGAAGIVTALGFVAGTSGLSGTLQTAAQTNITSLGSLTGLTINGGLSLTGNNYDAAWVKSADTFRLQDNTILAFGASDDLKLYHNGSHSFIDDAGAGNLYIRAGTDNGITLNSDSDVILYYDNSLKFQTTTDGTKTTGIATATAGVDITGGTLGLRLGTGATVFSPGSNLLALGTNDKERLRIQSDGSINVETALGVSNQPLVEIYNKDGSVMTGQCLKLRSNRGSGVIDTAIFAIHDDSDEEFFRVDNGGSVGIGTTSCGQNLHIMGTQAAILVEGSVQGRIILRDNAASDATARNFDLVSVDEDFKLRKLSDNFASASDYLTIDKSGNATFAASVSDSKGDVRKIIYQNKTSGYTLVASDAGKAIHISTGGVTINDSIFSAGDAVTIINNSGSDQTITQGSGVTLYDTGDDGSTGNKTLKGRGMATVWFSSASVGYISGNF